MQKDRLLPLLLLKHCKRYGYHYEDVPVEVVTCRIHAWLPTRKPDFVSTKVGVSDITKAAIARQQVFLEEIGNFMEIPTYSRALLSEGDLVLGPAIIEQMDTTIFIPTNKKAYHDGFNNLVMT